MYVCMYVCVCVCFIMWTETRTPEWKKQKNGINKRMMVIVIVMKHQGLRHGEDGELKEAFNHSINHTQTHTRIYTKMT